MKQLLIVGLICLNAALLMALAFGAAAPQANAQAAFGAVPYVVTTGRIGANMEAVYILDLSTPTRRLLAWRYDGVARRLVPSAMGRELLRDFERK